MWGTVGIGASGVEWVLGEPFSNIGRGRDALGRFVVCARKGVMVVFGGQMEG